MIAADLQKPFSQCQCQQLTLTLGSCINKNSNVKNILHCRKFLQRLFGWITSVEDLKNVRLVCTSWCQVSSPLLQTMSTVNIEFPMYDKWILSDNENILIPPPPSSSSSSSSIHSNSSSSQMLATDFDSIITTETNVDIEVDSVTSTTTTTNESKSIKKKKNFHKFKEYIENVGENRIFFKNCRYTFAGHRTCDPLETPPFLKQSSIEFIFKINGLNQVLENLHIVHLNCLPDPHQIVTDLFPKLKSVVFESCSVAVSNSSPLCGYPLKFNAGPSSEAQTKIFPSDVNSCYQLESVKIQENIQSVQWTGLELYSDTPGLVSLLPPEKYKKTRTIIYLPWESLFRRFPNLTELYLLDLDKWEITECLSKLHYLQKRGATSLKIKKMYIREAEGLDVLLMTDDNYETVEKAVEKIIWIMPSLEHLSLRLKADVVKMETILKSRCYKLKTLKLERTTSIELNVLNKSRDVDYRVFISIFPQLKCLHISNYYLGSFDEITECCPALKELYIDFEIIEICKSPRDWSFLSMTDSDDTDWDKGVFMRTCCLLDIDRVQSNETVKTLCWNVPSVPFSELLDIFTPAFTYIPQVFPAVNRLSATILSETNLMVLFKEMTQLVELTILGNSTYKTNDSVITGQFDNNNATTTTTANNSDELQVVYKGISTMTNLKRASFLNNNNMLTNEALTQGFLCLPELNYLRIERTHAITMSPNEMKTLCPSLMTVTILKCQEEEEDEEMDMEDDDGTANNNDYDEEETEVVANVSEEEEQEEESYNVGQELDVSMQQDSGILVEAMMQLAVENPGCTNYYGSESQSDASPALTTLSGHTSSQTK